MNVETNILEPDALTEIKNTPEEGVIMGTGACTMCDCKKYDEASILKMKCKCGHGKRFHLDPE